MSESAPPQPGPPPESESGRESDEIERDAGVDAWKHHASRDEPRHAGTPSSELAGEPVEPAAQDDPSDSG
jgi:hypothetical protein